MATALLPGVSRICGTVSDEILAISLLVVRDTPECELLGLIYAPVQEFVEGFLAAKEACLEL